MKLYFYTANTINGYCIPMGYSTFTDKEMLIKIRDCDEIPDGEKVGIIEYVKKER